MNRYQEARRTALNVEEAALLPAGLRPMDGGAALSSARSGAERMADMRLGPERTWGTTEPGLNVPTVQKPASRAALHHVLGKQNASVGRKSIRGLRGP